MFIALAEFSLNFPSFSFEGKGRMPPLTSLSKHDQINSLCFLLPYVTSFLSFLNKNSPIFDYVRGGFFSSPKAPRVADSIQLEVPATLLRTIQRWYSIRLLRQGLLRHTILTFRLISLAIA